MNFNEHYRCQPRDKPWARRRTPLPKFDTWQKHKKRWYSGGRGIFTTVKLPFRVEQSYRKLAIKYEEEERESYEDTFVRLAKKHKKTLEGLSKV